ncbi:hypothetical protein F5884DRAFT_754277 [Xylogone sp. PMI_703]|nr:hypothetical protein F5884DRAFT_754277 [Xylogone sp. PMI_703]
MFRRTHKYRPTWTDPEPTPDKQQGKPQSFRHIWLDYLRPFFASLPYFLSWPFRQVEIVNALFQNRWLKCEEPKAITNRSKWRAVSGCSIHIFPTGITIVLLVLNFCQVYAGDTPVQSNALQFAAKFHEILIAASLSNIAIHYVQYRLLHEEGVPFGGILTGFQLANLNTLWSPGLWATAVVGMAKIQQLLWVFFIIILIILVAIVGPASAILMLPSLDWWEVQMTDLNYGNHLTTDDARIFVKTKESALWPSHITLANFYLPECSFSNQTVPVYCPLGSFTTLLDLSTQYTLTDDFWLIDNSNYLPRWNITFLPESPVSFSRYLEGALGGLPLGEFSNPSETIVALTQTTPLAADILLSLIQDAFNQGPIAESFRFGLLMKNNSLILAPSTSVMCIESVYEWKNGSLTDLLSSSDQPRLVFPLPNGKTWSAPLSKLLDVWSNTTGYAAIWVEAPDLGEDSPSIGAVFTSFGIDGRDNQLPGTTQCCSVISSWEPIQIYTYPLSSDLFRSPTTDNVLKLAYDPSYLTRSKAIKFDIDWAETAIPANATLAPLQIKLSGGPLVENFRAAVSIFVTNVLARVSANNTVVFTGSQMHADVNTGNWTEFRATVDRNGYSYSMRGVTRRLAAGILLVHILIVIIYMVIVIWSGWYCIGMKSLIEIIALAINSTPTKILGNTSAGISRFDTYKHIIKIRVVSNLHLELVFDGDGSADEVEDGELYG